MDISPHCFSINRIVTFDNWYISFNIPKNGRKFNSSRHFVPSATWRWIILAIHFRTSQSARAKSSIRVVHTDKLFTLFYAVKLWLILTAFWCTLPFSIEVLFGFRCGYATLHDVNDKTQEDRMESFFLSETCKYLYLVSTEVFVTDYRLRVYKKWKCRNEMIILKAHQELVLSLDQSKEAWP